MKLKACISMNPRAPRGARALAAPCAALALLSGVSVACDADEVVLADELVLADDVGPADASLAAAAAPDEDEVALDPALPWADGAPEPIHFDGADVGPDVFSGSWSSGQNERLADTGDRVAALVAPDLDPQILRQHGAEPMQQFKNASAPAAGTIPSPAGYGHYCSMTWPSGGWALAWDTNGNDPCAWLIANSDPGGTIERAGMFSAANLNQAVMRCSDGFIATARGNGGGPLSLLFSAGGGHPGCIFTASPQSLPIFERSPLPTNASISPGTLIDFARGPIMTLNTTLFGHAAAPYGSTAAQIVDRLGRARSTAAGWINGHDSLDLNVARGTEVYAIANGKVIASRWLDTQCTGSDGPVQGEVYIRHTVARNPSTYNETFVAAYFHLQLLIPIAPGADVVAGDYLGDTGNMGCSSQPHLHFATIRETNVADRRLFTVQVPLNMGNNGGGRTIDPYGWFAPAGVDPWAWRAYPDGAFSVNLWKAGAAPPQGDWGAGID